MFSLGLLRLMFFFSSRRRHTRCSRDWSSDVCSSDLEYGFGGAAAERLDANRARSRKKVEESRTGNIPPQHVEEGLAQAVAGRAKGQAFKALQNAAAIGAGDHAHRQEPRYPTLAR